MHVNTSTQRTTGSNSWVLRSVLILLGIISAFVAANVAFGGLETLGWQGPTKYVTVSDHDAYLLRDSHARFYGGVYLGIGMFLIVASTNLRKYRTALHLVFALIFLGGLARLSQNEPDVTFGSDLAVSTIVELVGMPALAVWVAMATRSSHAGTTVTTTAPSAPSLMSA
jgi:Domain of unknown function (DUF4345)